MRFAPTVEQVDLRAVAAELLADRCPPSAIRAGAGSPQATQIVAGLAEVGATALLVPEEAGGLGLDENHLVSVMEEIGYAAPPLPLIGTIAVAPALLTGTDRIGALAAGQLLATADPDGTGRVPSAAAATVALTGGRFGRGVIRVIDLAAARRDPVVSVDPAAGLATYTGGDTVAEIADPAAVLLAWRRGVLAAAAQLVGLSRRMLDMTVAYVAERKQFGAPIGSFQAVKHHLASALIAVEFAAPVVAAAGAQLAAEPEAADEAETARELAAAKALASDAAMTVARATLQCHGAIAYTTEYDWQLYAKRAWALAAAWGSAREHRAELAVSLGLTGARG